MIIGTCKIYLNADWVNSLKEKRSVVKSIIEKAKNKFNISIAEIDNQDFHKNIAIGFACVSNSTHHANNMIQNVVDYVENNTDAEIVEILVEIL